MGNYQIPNHSITGRGGLISEEAVIIQAFKML
jgi:hypothetical protein